MPHRITSIYSPHYPSDDYHYQIIHLGKSVWKGYEIEFLFSHYANIEITRDDLLTVLSKDKPNYISSGSAKGNSPLIRAFKNALRNLPHGLDGVARLILQIYAPIYPNIIPVRDFQRLNEMIRSLNPDINLTIGHTSCSPIGMITVVLITTYQ